MGDKNKVHVRVEIKALSEDGSFEGLLAVYNNVDLGKDLIEPGAFKKSIQERGNTVPLLWQHDPKIPIGSLELQDGPDALRVKGQLLMDIPEAKNAYSLIKAQVIKGLSIGYDTIKDSIEDSVRHLKELRLWEGSIVTFPMNEAAMITSVKMKDGKVVEIKGDFNEELSENQLQSAGYQMQDALCTALCSVTWASGLDNAQKLDAAKLIISQYTEAYLAYYPQYLDWLSSQMGDTEYMGKLEHEHKSFVERIHGQKAVSVTDELKATIAKELKEGRKLSAATKKSIKAAYDLNTKAMGHMKDANDIFDALLDDEADDESIYDDPEQMGKAGAGATSETKAAEKIETEPATSHSAAVSSILQKAKESYQWTLSKQN